MKSKRQYYGASSVNRYTVAVALLLPLLTSALAVGNPTGVTAEPSQVVFHSQGQEETVKLNVGDTPVGGDEIIDWRMLVDAKDYKHMLNITPTADGVRITPSNTVEIGSYDLHINTNAGNVVIQVFTPLSEHSSSLDALAKRMDIEVAELRRQMGLTQRLGRDQITLNLLPVYYLGQRIIIEMPNTGNRFLTWRVNGAVVLEGANASRFSFAPSEAGPLLVSYEEREDNVVVAQSAGLTEVAEQPALDYEVHSDTQVQFQAPPGFSRYAWTLDAAPVSTADTFAHVFNQSGKHLVKVRMDDGEPSNPYEFRVVIYDVTVKPAQP